MRSIAKEKLDIIVNLSKLVDAEIRDERGITKLVLPIVSSGLKMTEFGNVVLRLVANPMSDNLYHSTHCITMAKKSDRVKDKRGKDIIGSVYLNGKHEFDEKRLEEARTNRDAKLREKEKKSKFKNLEF